MKIYFALFVCFGCFAQSAPSPSAAPAFDVASIHSTATCDSPHDVQTSPDSLTIRGRTLRVLIQWAYDMPLFPVSGPDWLRDNCFDVLAKAAGPVDETQLRLMLRALLADRFGLKAHIEQRVMQVYIMTLAKGGPKFHESTTEGPPVFDQEGVSSVTAHRVTMKELAARVSGPLGRPVLDETGLKGRYEIRVDLAGYMTKSAGGDWQVDLMSILFNGLQEQLGLKLEAKKQSVDILVVDRAEKSPTAN